MAKKLPAEKEQQLRTLRDRLYSRTQTKQTTSRHDFVGVNKLVERPQMPPPRSPQQVRDGTIVAASAGDTTSVPLMSQQSTPMLNGYRAKILATAGIFFAVALILSSSFLFFGQNTISADNIAIAVDAPRVVGGGETLSFTVAVTNRNAVAVESATLIVTYPPGTQSSGGTGKELFQERISLGSIASGEVLNTPVTAKIFGEENEERVLTISVEYRVAGSNATFFKEAEPVRLRVNSSPVVLSIEGNTEVSSGQEVVLTLTIASNTQSPLENLLVSAEYPAGFDFSESTPKPAKGQNVWSIDTLAVGEKEQITLKGAMLGGSAEVRTFVFSAGVPNERDRFALSSVLTTAETEVTITDPFIELTVQMNGSTEKTISVSHGESVSVLLTFKNTLADTIYDGAITAVLSGNGLNANNVSVSGGFYDSSTNTIVWDSGSVSGLAELASGETETVSFSIRGASIDATRTPQISYDVSVSGRRVSESRVPQELTHIVSRTIRFESAVSLASHGLYSIGPFSNSGPVPPKAETPTQYTIVFNAHNGSNELAAAAGTAPLPAYVTWTGATTGDTDFAYNTGTREVTWRIGNLAAGGSANGAFQVSFLPSVSQVGTVPTVVGTQNFRATDRFTGTVVRAAADALTTHLPEDPNPAAQVGRVEPK